MTRPYVILHLDLDGALIDRDDGHPDVELELHPMGTQLPEDQQRHELVIVLDPDGKRPRRTRLDTTALRDLMNFLNENAKVEPGGG